MLRHRAPSSPIYLSEVTSKPFVPSQVFLLFSGGKIVLLVKKKAPSHSRFHLSMHVVLKTRHISPNIHVRRFIVHVRSSNLSATRLQLLPLRGSNNLIEVISQSYIGISPKLYSSTHAPIYLYGDHCTRPPLHSSYLLLEKRRSHLIHPRMGRCQVGSCLE